MRSIPIMIMLSLLGGCAPLNTKQSAAPPLKPQPVTNVYEKALRCVGDMLDIYSSDSTPIVVAVRPVLDQTTGSFHSGAEIPAQVTVMILTALNTISPRIRFSDTLFEGALSEQATKPHLIVEGAITEFDRAETMEANSSDAGLSVKEFEVRGEKKTTYALSRIALDLHVVEYPSQISIPYVNSSLQTRVARHSSEWGWALSVYSLGIGNSVVKKQIDGAHGALRLTADLAVLQLIGRRFILPWQRCLPDDFVEDEVVKIRALTLFRRATREKQVEMIQELLNYHGDLTVKRTGIWDPATARALDELRRKHKFLWRDTDRETIYWTLYKNVPLDRRVHNRETF